MSKSPGYLPKSTYVIKIASSNIYLWYNLVRNGLHIGDIHGQYYDLLRLFDYGGYPPKSNYLFLGQVWWGSVSSRDYVDRGKQSIECICLLFAYKVKYPNKFFLLRGNHETDNINKIYGFYDECKRRYSIRLWKAFSDCFKYLPVSAIIEDRIICMHGGLSPSLTELSDIENIKRPSVVPDNGLLCDLLWSDPEYELSSGWGYNDRGVSYIFAEDVVHAFLEDHDLELVCRAHQVVEDGYEFFADRHLVTIFSAPNYCGEFDNAGAIMYIDETLMCSFQVMLMVTTQQMLKAASQQKMYQSVGEQFSEFSSESKVKKHYDKEKYTAFHV